jgi:hypothetical protein
MAESATHCERNAELPGCGATEEGQTGKSGRAQRAPNEPTYASSVGVLEQTAAASGATSVALGWHEQRNGTGDREEQCTLQDDTWLHKPAGLRNGAAQHDLAAAMVA